jgi:hypothetical protein
MGNGPTSVICGNNILLAQNVGSIKQNSTTTPGDMEIGLSCLGLKGIITKVFFRFDLHVAYIQKETHYACQRPHFIIGIVQ